MKLSRVAIERKAAMLALGFEDSPPPQKPRKPKRARGEPTDEELRRAVLESWIGVQLYFSPEQFLTAFRGREHLPVVHNWLEQALIWERYAAEASAAAAHFETNPAVYGAHTTEMVARFRANGRAHTKTAQGWRAYVEWASTHPMPLSVRGYDPTGHYAVERDWCPRDRGVSWSGLPISGLPRKYWLPEWRWQPADDERVLALRKHWGDPTALTPREGSD
jgi:hypothetical protein